MAHRSIRRTATAAAVAVMCVMSPAVTAHAAPGSRTLYVTGSDSNDVAAFTIAPSGIPAPLGTPIPAGTGSRGVVFTPDRRHAYVSDNLGNMITVFDVATDGMLTSRAVVPTQGSAPFGIAIAPDGTALYVVEQTLGQVERFGIGAAGALSPAGPPLPVAAFPRGIAVAPGGRFVYVTHGFPGLGAPGVITSYARATDGSLTPIGTPQRLGTGTGGALITITPDGRYLYTEAQDFDEALGSTEGVYGFRIGGDGTLHPLPDSPVPSGNEPEGIAVTPDARHLYVASDAIWGYTIAPDGRLSPVPGTPSAAGTCNTVVVPAPDGHHLYAVDFDSSQLYTFTIAADGRLHALGEPKPTGGSLPGFQSLSIAPDQAPTAAFSAQPADRPLTVRFDATGSADPDGTVARYDWDFGDGTHTTGPTPAHRYTHPGTFQVTLTVTDNEGCSTQLIFTGQSALCNGSRAAITTHATIARG